MEALLFLYHILDSKDALKVETMQIAFINLLRMDGRLIDVVCLGHGTEIYRFNDNSSAVCCNKAITIIGHYARQPPQLEGHFAIINLRHSSETV